MLPLFAEDTDSAISLAQSVLENFIQHYEAAWLKGMRAKCGLSSLKSEDKEDRNLIEALLDTMHDDAADFTLTFYYLSQLNSESGQADLPLCALFKNPASIEAWLVRWRERLQSVGVPRTDVEHRNGSLEHPPTLQDPHEVPHAR